MKNKSPKDYLTDRLEKMRDLILNHIAIQSGYTIGVNTLKEFDEYGKRIEAFLTQTITQSMEMGRKEERDSWLNQRANEHDRRIREDEKERLLKEVEEKVIGKDEVCTLPQTEDNIMEYKQVAIRNNLRAEQRKALSDIGGKNE